MYILNRESLLYAHDLLSPSYPPEMVAESKIPAAIHCLYKPSTGTSNGINFEESIFWIIQFQKRMPCLRNSQISSVKGNLPQKDAEAEGSGSRTGFPPLTLKKRLTGLVVDAQRTCQMIQKGLLVHYGVDTQVVNNGKEAVDLFASGADFDVVVIDMYLPVMNGLEATRQIRAMGARSKIIGYTAFGNESERAQFMEAGADEFFAKPVEPEALVRILGGLDDRE